MMRLFMQMVSLPKTHSIGRYSKFAGFTRIVTAMKSYPTKARRAYLDLKMPPGHRYQGCIYAIFGGMVLVSDIQCTMC